MSKTTTFFDEEIGAVIWEISGVANMHYFKTVSEITHLLREKHNSIKQINCIKNMNSLSDEIQAFIKNNFFEMAKRSGLKYFAFVIPECDKGQLSMNIANNGAAQKWDMEIEYFSNKQEAVAWLNSK